MKLNLSDATSDNRGMDETEFHFGGSLLTVVIGIEEALDIIKNAFENNGSEPEERHKEAFELIEKLRLKIQQVDKLDLVSLIADAALCQYAVCDYKNLQVCEGGECRFLNDKERELLEHNQELIDETCNRLRQLVITHVLTKV